MNIKSKEITYLVLVVGIALSPSAFANLETTEENSAETFAAEDVAGEAMDTEAPASTEDKNFPADQSKGDSEKNKEEGKKSDLYEEASEAAAREMGRSLVRNMQPKERQSLLDKYRDALRADIMRAQYLERKNAIYGYVMATREGYDNDSNYCREIEMDLIYRGQRFYEVNTFCQFSDGLWHPVAPETVRFSTGGSPKAPKPVPSPGKGNGDWLPPLN